MTASGDDLGRLLDQLSEAGSRRGAANRHTPDGMAALATAYHDIRAWTPEAARLGATKRAIAAAVGISTTQLNNILNGAAGAAVPPPAVSPEAAGIAVELRELAEKARRGAGRIGKRDADLLDRAVAVLSGNA